MASKEEKNKAFFLEYLTALSGHHKNRELIQKYVSDPRLIEHILFFEDLFPKYELVIQELMAQGDRIILRSQFIGTHTGQREGIPSTMQQINTPFATGYQIIKNKIVDFWAIANEVELFEQMGLIREEVNVQKKDGK